MAVSERVSVEFVIKDDYDGKGLRQAKRDVDAIGESGKKVEGTFELLRTKMDRIAGAMTPLNQGLELVAKAGRFAKEAFDFVQEGANLNQQAQALRNVGIELDRVAAAAKEASAGLVSDKQIQAIISQFDAYGLSIEYIPDVIENAAKASVRMGITVEDAVSRMVRGVGRMEPLLLDDLGILSKVSDFQEEAARATGKSVKELTALETRAGALSFALRRLEESNQGVNLATADMANVMGRAEAAVENALAAVKQWIALGVQDTLLDISGPAAQLEAIRAVAKGQGRFAEQLAAAGTAARTAERDIAAYAQQQDVLRGFLLQNGKALNVMIQLFRAQPGRLLNENLEQANDQVDELARRFGIPLEIARRIADEGAREAEYLGRQAALLEGLGGLDKQRVDAVKAQNRAVDAQVAPMLRLVESMGGLGEASRLQAAAEKIKLDIFLEQEGSLNRQQTIFHDMIRQARRTSDAIVEWKQSAEDFLKVWGKGQKKPRGRGGAAPEGLTMADRIRTEALQEQNRRLQRMNGLSGLGLTLARQKAAQTQTLLALEIELLEIAERKATPEKKAELAMQARLRAANSLAETSKNIALTEKQIADANRARLLEGVALRTELAKVDAEHAAERLKLARERDQSGPGGGTVLDLGVERAYRRELQHRQEVLIARERELAIAQATAAVGGDTSNPEYAIALKQAEFDAETKLARAEMERRAAGREHFAQAAQEISGYIGVVGEAVSHVGSLIDLMETEFGVITKGSKSAEEAQQRLADHKRTMAVAESLVKHFQYVGEAAAATARYEYAAAASYTLAATMHGIVAGVNAAAIGRPPPGRQTETGNAASRNTDRPTTPATVININAPFFTGGNQELGALFNNLSQMGETSGMQEAV